jgi:hypothetical protein
MTAMTMNDGSVTIADLTAYPRDARVQIVEGTSTSAGRRASTSPTSTPCRTTAGGMSWSTESSS